MAQMTAKSYVQKDVIGSFLRDQIKKTAGGPRITGTITVAPGHDYWWFLEYGTGEHHEDPDGELNPPRKARSRISKGPYEIVFKKKRGRRGALTYMSGGIRRYAASVIHPGARPNSFIRVNAFRMRKDLRQELDKLLKRLSRRKRLPTREMLVDLVNDELLVLLRRIQDATPEDSDPDPYHEDERPRNPPLSEAWDVDLAE